jgi:hypothetical protein
MARIVLRPVEFITYTEACERVAQCKSYIGELRTATTTRRSQLLREIERLAPGGVYRSHEPGKETHLYLSTGPKRRGKGDEWKFVVPLQRISSLGHVVGEEPVEVPLIGLDGFLTPLQMSGVEGHAYERVGDYCTE